MDWWDKQFESQGQSAFFWFRQAARLKYAADLVANGYEAAAELFRANPDAFIESEAQTGQVSVEFDSFPVYVFLYGLALENLAKGILVGRNSKRLSGKHKPNHGVRSYVMECGLQLTESRMQLLLEVESSIRWTGRYPVPMKPDEWNLRSGKYGANQIPGTVSPNDRQELEQLYSAVQSVAQNERKIAGTI